VLHRVIGRAALAVERDLDRHQTQEVAVTLA
jgi:hypothetical protein